MKTTHRSSRVREDAAPYACQETLAAGIAHGRHEEHQRASKMIRQVIVEIANVRFPVIAAFVEQRVGQMQSFAVLHQFVFVVSTAWSTEDVLRFILGFDDARESAV